MREGEESVEGDCEEGEVGEEEGGESTEWMRLKMSHWEDDVQLRHRWSQQAH